MTPEMAQPAGAADRAQANPVAHLEALRQTGAPGFDPVRWHYIEVLAHKAQSQSPQTQALLQQQLAAALEQLQTRMRAAAQPDVHPMAPTTLQTSPLAQLLQHWPAATPNTHTESPRLQQFRKTLSHLHRQKQVTQAMAQAPHNAGPINSHMLVLRSLGLMREHAPDYLSRFMAYVDTLLSLQEAGQTRPRGAKSASSRKPKK